MDKTRRKLKPLARKRRNFLYLLLGILFAITTSYILFTYPPDYKIKIINLQIPLLPFFLMSLFVFIYSVVRFIFISSAQALLTSVLILVYLIFRLIGLTYWIFAGLFLALFIVAQLFVVKKK